MDRLWKEFTTNFSIEYCRRHQIIGLRQDNGSYELRGTTNTQRFIVDLMRRFFSQPLAFQPIEMTELQLLINAQYEAAMSQTRQDTETKDHSLLLGGLNEESTDDLLESEKQGDIVRLVNETLLEAIQVGASDVHFQPMEKSLQVRMRLDGVLEDVRTLSRQIQEEIVSRIKVAGRMNIAEKRLPQDGRATVRVGVRTIDLRLASMPTSFGERVVIRLLDKSARLYQLSELGMNDQLLERFRKLIHVEHGLILVTGPTGSGKSTTLYAALQELDTRHRNAVTLEDPIEYQLNGISQTQINTKKGMTFASGLRSILRQDPDIIMVGEIRDEETAVMAVQAALTGHLVFSTLHTNDAASAVTRLLDLGIEPYLISSSLLGVLAQRLVRRKCTKCDVQARKNMLDDEVNLGISLGVCNHCRGTGYRGRDGIYELLLVSDAIRQKIQDRSSASVIRETACQEGMRLLRDSGMEKVQMGWTTVEEVERVTMRADL